MGARDRYLIRKALSEAQIPGALTSLSGPDVAPAGLLQFHQMDDAGRNKQASDMMSIG